MKRLSIFDKLNIDYYIDNLSDNMKTKLELVKLLLNEEELKSLSSIQVAYNIARERYIDEYLVKVNPQLAKRAREGAIPLFFKIETIRDLIEKDIL